MAAPPLPRTRPGALRALVGGGLTGTAHVALDLVWGSLVALVAGVVVAAGVSGLAVLGTGVLLLLLALAGARGLGALERARFSAVLGVVIPPPPPLPATTLWERTKHLVASGTTWRAVAWVVLLPVLGVVWATVVLGLWAAALALGSVPLWQGAATGRAGAWLVSTGALGAVAAVVLAVALAAAALLAARGCAAADVALARVLVGGDETAALTRRVETLTTARAGVVDAADAERRRIERDLHDGAQQRLVALAVTLGMASAKLDADPRGLGGLAEARALVRTAHGEAKAAVAELRDLARGIHPAVLTDRGLDAALSALAARSPVPVTVDVDPSVAAGARCSATVEATAYFVVAEALTNVARHARASRARVAVTRRDGALVVVVQDDGRGGAQPAGGTGLAGLGQRVAGVDGALHLSSPTGGPTTLTVELPCTP